MKRKDIKTKWVLPCGTGAMWMKMRCSPDSCHLVRVEADLQSDTSGVELTIAACKGLWDFLHDYHRRNISPDLLDGVRSGILPTEGIFVDVLPKHADEIAARIAAFITDATNYHVRAVGDVPIVCLARGLTSPMRTWTDVQAKASRLEARRMVEAEFPQFIADPLGEFPGNRPDVTV